MLVVVKPCKRLPRIIAGFILAPVPSLSARLLVCGYSAFLLSVVAIVEDHAAQTSRDSDINIIYDAMEVLALNTISFMSTMQIWTTIDHHLYNILLEEEQRPQQFKANKALQIDGLSDPQALKIR